MVAAGTSSQGWHTFRRSYATLLHDAGPTLAVQKELLRHADVATTLKLYTQAVPAAMRDAASQAVGTLWKN
jgi:integrase